MNQSNFLTLFFLLLVVVVFSSCSSSQDIVQNTSIEVTQNDTSKVIGVEKPVLAATDVKYLVILNEETELTLNSKSAILKITGANSNDESVVLSVKQGAGENVKKIKKNQVISFGALRICVDEIMVDDKMGSAQALLIPTYSQKAVSWFSMAVPSDANETCSVFTRAVELSDEKNGAVTFFSEQLADVIDNDDFVTDAYNVLLGKSLDSLNLQAWKFYVAENGRDKFLALLVESDEFKSRENSIK